MKAKIIFEFETKDDGIIVTAKTKGIMPNITPMSDINNVKNNGRSISGRPLFLFERII